MSCFYLKSFGNVSKVLAQLKNYSALKYLPPGVHSINIRVGGGGGGGAAGAQKS